MVVGDSGQQTDTPPKVCLFYAILCSYFESIPIVTSHVSTS
jgi:hypothetical protein